MSDNTGLDVSVLEAVLDSGDTETRTALAIQLAQLLADAETPAIERQQVVPILLKLSVDPTRDVRMVLAEELTNEAQLDGDVVFSILADDDDIALPFLAVTPSLTARHMMAVLRVGDECRQVTVVSRSDLTEEAATHAIHSSSLPVVLALFENSHVAFENSDYHALYKRFGHSELLVEKLLTKADLPLDIRITQARRTASRLRQLVLEKSWVPAHDLTEVVADAEDTAVLQVLIEASAEERVGAMNFLASKNMLTPALILRAATQGEMRVVEAGLAHLTGQSTARIAAVIGSDAAIGFKGLFKKSGLPQSCYGILKASCEVYAEAREEGLPLRSDEFGRRVLEALMTRFEYLGPADKARQIEYLGRYADERVRKVARRIKADVLRAA